MVWKDKKDQINAAKHYPFYLVACLVVGPTVDAIIAQLYLIPDN